jgi:hypothetical protein
MQASGQPVGFLCDCVVTGALGPVEPRLWPCPGQCAADRALSMSPGKGETVQRDLGAWTSVRAGERRPKEGTDGLTLE